MTGPDKTGAEQRGLDGAGAERRSDEPDAEQRGKAVRRADAGAEPERGKAARRADAGAEPERGKAARRRPGGEAELGEGARWSEEGEDGPDAEHRRPEGLDDVTVQALGKLSEALETVERVRGHLYAMHQLTGTADFMLDEAVSLFMQAGHTDVAERIQRQLIGRNVIPGQWTFQIVEAYDDGYYTEFRDVERDARERLAQGRRHLYEAELKERRRTRGRPGHEALPGYSG